VHFQYSLVVEALTSKNERPVSRKGYTGASKRNRHAWEPRQVKVDQDPPSSKPRGGNQQQRATGVIQGKEKGSWLVCHELRRKVLDQVKIRDLPNPGKRTSKRKSRTKSGGKNCPPWGSSDEWGVPRRRPKALCRWGGKMKGGSRAHNAGGKTRLQTKHSIPDEKILCNRAHQQQRMQV